MKRFFLLGLAAACLSVWPTNAANAQNWPGFRGANAAGNGDGQNPPVTWDAEKNINIAWKTPIPGLAHASPIVWGDKLFVVSAVSSSPQGKFRHGLYGDVDSDKDISKHSWKLFCLDKKTGKILWERTATEGVPKVKRHIKSTHASPSPVTDGKYVVSFFGSEGLYCYDFNGKLMWKTPIAKIASVGMGPSTSPVMADGVIVLQCDEDEGKKSFIAGVDKKTGKELWRTPRPVQAGWSTPLVVKTDKGTEVVASGFEWIISYEPKTGKELWKMKSFQSNALPTPLVGFGMVYAYSGYPTKKTLAIKLGGSGDITDTALAWSYDKGTAYIPSSILYGDNLYLMTDRGILTCLDAKTGKVIYEGGRIPVPATFTASPVAFDGKVLLTSEDGDTYVVKAGSKYEILATNSLGEPVYASPAISDGMIFIRGEKNLYCISNKK